MPIKKPIQQYVNDVLRFLRSFLYRLRHRRALPRRQLVVILWLACVLLMAVAAEIYRAQGALDYSYDRPYRKDIEAFRGWLAQEEDAHLIQARELSHDPVLRQAVDRHDIPDLDQALTLRRRDMAVAGIVAIDKNGVALSRGSTVGVRGDIPFLSMAWGRAAARNSVVVSIEHGTTWPLVMIASAPLVHDGAVQGAVAVAEFLNDPYVRTMAQAALPSGAQIVAYTPDTGMIATTFTNARTRQLITPFFSSGSDWVQNRVATALIRVGSQTYVATNIVFPGLEDSPGGLVVLLPFHQFIRSLWLATTVVVIAVVFMIALMMSLPRPWRRRRLWVALVSGGTFIVSVFLSTYFPSRNTIVVGPPAYRIYNSVLTIDPKTQVYDLAYDQQTAVRVHSGGEAVNAIQATIDFDPTAVDVKNISMTGSVCSPDLIITKAVDPAGRITIACGVKPPGFSSDDGLVANILFRPRRPGLFTFHFAADTSVLANDGLGTDVLRNAIDGAYAAVNAADDNADPVVTSPTHPDPDQWYRATKVRFVWSTPGPVRYAFDQSPTLQSSSLQRPNGRSVSVQATGSGTYYFHLASDARNAPSVTMPVRIDTQPPTSLTLRTSSATVRAGDILRVKLGATDAVSGLQRTYYLRVDRDVFLPVGMKIDMVFDRPGKHTLTMRVFDNAGNFADMSIRIMVVKK